LEFKLAIFQGNHLKRWETLPENRHYRARYNSVRFESSEADLGFNETILKKFVSSQSLENLDDYKRVKKTKQFFNPFDNAQNSFTSESWDESSLDKISSEDFTSPRFYGNPALFFHTEEQTQDTEGVKTEMDFPQSHKENFKDIHHESVKIDRSFNKQMNLRSSPAPRKKTLNPNEISDLESTLQALNDERPDIFSVLYQKYKNEKGMSRYQPTSLINSESREDLLVYELENELAHFGSNESVFVTCFKLPITVNLMNPNEGPVSKQWRVTEDTDSHLSTIYKFRNEKAKGLVWIGWIGIYVEEKYREELTNFLYKEYSCIPIFLEEDVVQSFLFDYCNKFMHNAFFANLTPDMIPLQEDYLDVFDKVNQTFAQKVLEYASINSLILIQDYHLMMVPKFIAQKNVKLTIVYIFDTPFPSLETIKAFYNRKELADSLLCSDLVCFSSNEHLKNFTRFSSQAAGNQLLTERGGHMYVLRGGRKIYLRTIQPCVDVQGIYQMKSTVEYQEMRAKLLEKYQGKNLLVNFSFLKKQEAIENLIGAFRLMAEAQTDQSYHLTIVYNEDFYLLDSQTNEKLAYLNTIKQQIAKINQALCLKCVNSSIELIEEDLSGLEKTVLLDLASLFVSFSSYIENDLKVFEYLLVNGGGGILLSDFSGGSRQFSLPMTVNPFSKAKISEAMKKVLSLDKSRMKSLMSSDQTLASRYSAWDQYYELFTDMKRTQTIKNKLNLMLIEENNEMKVISVKGAFRQLNPYDLKEAFKQAQRKVIICSYEDTLILEQILNNNNGNMEIAGPVNVPTEGIEIIKRLCMDPTVEFFVVSDKKVDTLATIFEEVPNVSLLAENGFFYKMSYETNWYNMYECDWSWKGIVQRIMQNYAVRIGGVKLEVKESSIVWDYKDVDNEIVKVQEIELASHLATVLTHVQNLEVIRGRNTVEVKAASVNKGLSSELILNRERLIKGKYPDFVLCLGGTRKDEEMFSRLGKMLRDGKDHEKVHWFTCTVGKKPSNARYYVDKVCDVYEALNLLAD